MAMFSNGLRFLVLNKEINFLTIMVSIGLQVITVDLQPQLMFPVHGKFIITPETRIS
jgi:hypothetical protein